MLDPFLVPFPPSDSSPFSSSSFSCIRPSGLSLHVLPVQTLVPWRPIPSLPKDGGRIEIQRQMSKSNRMPQRNPKLIVLSNWLQSIETTRSLPYPSPIVPNTFAFKIQDKNGLMRDSIVNNHDPSKLVAETPCELLRMWQRKLVKLLLSPVWIKESQRWPLTEADIRIMDDKAAIDANEHGLEF
ncbi:hypothetical protein LOK49_LG02G00198 [Camellia lanceoleosa]|uniref:Uncharacterized protein n=1 Tax=Camellia lanceoleosa TaxID=1840588 RepID=A0ACC0IG36_9ERIC|nr:hypothetical protein LOK49_LG02G00198 [Camellia lanceoleosa]